MLFGGLGIGLRRGLAQLPDAELGALHTQLTGFVVAVLAVLAAGQIGDIAWGDIWPLIALGAVVPGVTQLMWTYAVRDIGVSRAMVIVGAIPLASSVGAMIFLDEPFRTAIILGMLLIVGGAMLLAYERKRPANYRAVGALWAASTVLLFGVRDNVARWIALDTDLSGLGAAAGLITGAAAAMLMFVLMTRRGKKPLRQIRRSAGPFLVGGAFFGGAYLALMEAIDRGEVTVVIPLVGTFVIWTVVLAVIFLRELEAVSVRLAFASVLVVAGAAVVGATA